MIVVTGATGQLGGLVIDELLKSVDAREIVAAVRTPAKAGALARRGVEVREADYSRPETLRGAFQGAAKLLLISGTEFGSRVEQHKAAIDAAKSAGIGFVAYTSILHCDSSPLELAKEHLATEQYLRSSGLLYSFLRNGWYYENQTVAIPSALKNGAFIGSSGNGKIAAASRAEYAAAAAIVLVKKSDASSVLELGGDQGYTGAELAAEVTRQTGKTIAYNNLPGSEFEKILATFLPQSLASSVADAEVHAAEGALDDTSKTLSGLLGRPTSTLAEAVATALAAPAAAH